MAIASIQASTSAARRRQWMLAMAMPDNAPVPLWAPELDTGKFAKAIWMNRDKVLGKRIYAATDYVTPKQMLETFQKVYPEAGKSAFFFQLSQDMFTGALKIARHAGLCGEELWRTCS